MVDNKTLGIIDERAMIKDPPHARQWGPDFLVLDRGKGSRLRDVNGKEYVDLGAGIAVNTLGYGRGDLARIVSRQMKRLVHTSAVFTSPQTIAYGRRLLASGNFAGVHYGNSGTEANEAALKYARLYAGRTRGDSVPDCTKYLCFSGAFHGRTLGALSVTPTPAYQEPFAPLIPGVEVAPYNDVEALEEAVERHQQPGGNQIAGIIVEVVQGEGGLAVMTRDFAAALNRLCRRHDIILIADEVQTGLTRTGTIYGCEAVGLEPDIVTLAKPIAGGLPLGIALVPEKVNRLLKLGDHGGTFGGGPVTCALASYIWDLVTAPSFLAEVRRKAALLEQRLQALAMEFQDGPLQLGRELRGLGMLRGLEVVEPSGPEGSKALTMIRAKAQDLGVLVLRSGKNVLRLAPPLVITERDLDEGLRRLEKALQAVRAELEGA